MKNIQYRSIVILSILLNGCGLTSFTNRETNPAIQDYILPNVFSGLFDQDTADIFATKASHRLVISKMESCAEPSPDVGETFISSITNDFKVSVKADGSPINGELANDYAKEIATQIAPLLYRTQGLQLYRDERYSLCIDYMNGRIDKKRYDELITNLLDKAIPLIEHQLPALTENQQNFFKERESQKNKPLAGSSNAPNKK